MPTPGAAPPLPPFARDVLELYASALADVRFPDIDLSTLERCADALREAQEEVERLDAELNAAQERVLEHTSALLSRADRALVYARIFAEADPDLSAKVNAIAGNTAQPEEAPGQGARKRGRPRKPAAPAETQIELAAED